MFDQMSDEELEALASGKAFKQPPEKPAGVGNMSDEELMEIASGNAFTKSIPAPKASGSVLDKMGKSVLDAAVAVGSKIDSVTGAPTRAAIGAVMDGDNPVSAAWNQFGDDPEKAPTGKALAERVGLDGEKELSTVAPELYSEEGDDFLTILKKVSGLQPGHVQFKKHGVMDPTAAGAAGFAIDVAADPTNLAGAGFVDDAIKTSGKVVKAAGKGTAKAAQVVGDAATGGRLTKAVDVTKDTVKGVTNAVQKYTNPKVSDEFAELARIAKENGIDPADLPEAVEFGENSFITRASQNLAEGPLGEKKLNKFTDTLEKVHSAVGDKASKIAGGEVLDDVGAGAFLRESYDRGVDNFFKQMDITHNSVMDLAPGLPVSKKGQAVIDSKLNGIEKWAKGQLQRGITKTERTQADQLLKAVEAVRRGNGSYKQTYEALRSIGNVAFKSKSSLADIPPDIEKLRDLYFSVDEGLRTTVRQRLGNKIADSLETNNKAMSNFFKENALISGQMGSKTMADENLFRSLVVNGDTKRIGALKKILPPEDLNKLKGAMLESLIKRDIDGNVSFKKLHGALRDRKSQLASLFSPEELQGIEELVRLGNSFGSPVLSRSGTGASNSFREFFKDIGNSVVNERVVEHLKNKARVRNARDVTNLVDEASDVSSMLPTAKQTIVPPALVETARVGQKGAVVAESAERNREPENRLIEQIEMNPALLDTINNPRLKNQILKQIQRRRDQRDSDTMEGMLSPGKEEVPRDAKESFLEGN